MAYFEYKPSSPLYHYSSSAGFEGITSNRSVWLSDLQHANDPKELQLAEVIDRVLLELTKEEPSGEFRKAYARMKFQLKHLRSRFGIYCLSLSLKADQLPMWQEYTDRGRGYCIGFRATAFDDMPLRIQRVKYVDPHYLGTLHPEIASIVAPLAGKPDDFFELLEPSSRILSLIASTKDNTWQHEDEVRLTFSQFVEPQKDSLNMPVSVLRDGSYVYASHPQKRNRNGIDVPYFDMKFGRLRNGKWDADGAIQHVIVGPNNTRSLDEISKELKGKGYRGFEISNSRCAFRP